jgi:hypothetical protein
MGRGRLTSSSVGPLPANSDRMVYTYSAFGYLLSAVNNLNETVSHGDYNGFVRPGYEIGAIAGGLIGGASGALSAYSNGSDVYVGAAVSGAVGAAIGASGSYIAAGAARALTFLGVSQAANSVMASLMGQIMVRFFAAGAGNLAQQASARGMECVNWGSVASATAGGAATGLFAPAAWGASFSPGFALQVGERAIAALPAASLGATVAIGGIQATKHCGCPR